MSGQVGLYPEWKQAVKDVLAAPHEPGTIIEREWLDKAFDLKPPATPDDVRRNQLLFMTFMDRFRQELLTEHRIALRTIPGVGYEILAPGEQTRFAVEEGMRRLKRDMSWMRSTIIHVDHSKLTDAQRQENADALARSSVMRTMMRRASRMEISKEETALIK